MRLLPALALATALVAPLGCSDASAADAPAAQRAVAPTPQADSARSALLSRADLGRIQGRDSARVWLVVISDFQCPFCKRWHEQTAPRLYANYVRTGKIRIAYLNLPISSHRNAQPAHEAAMCAAEQGAFWPVADALFASQDAWKSKFEVEPYFDSLATRHVRDAARFRRCIASGATRAVIDADVARINRIGVGSTPTFFVGRQMLVGAQPYEAFARALDAALADSTTR